MFSLTPTSEAGIGNSRVLRFEPKGKLFLIDLIPRGQEELRECKGGPSFCCHSNTKNPPTKLGIKAISSRPPCI